MKTVEVLGMGVGNGRLCPSYEEILQKADVLAGGKRLLDRAAPSHAQQIVIESPLERVLDQVREAVQAGKRVVVLADGDPGFFGIGQILVKTLGREHVRIHPNVTVLQAAASRLGISWQDIKAVSLHGRQDMSPLFRALAFADRVAVYTDPENSPQLIALEMCRRRVDTFEMHVFENLGLEDERTGRYTLAQTEDTDFCPLNFLLLQRMSHPEILPHVGMDDDCYIHERGQITKKEIRAAGLAALRIHPRHVLWDLGAGSGSVAIEASLLARRGRVFAVEKRVERVEQIRENIRRTGCYHVEAVHGEMPDCLFDLPEPDRIFMGGGVGKNNKVLMEAARRLRPGGRIVLHLVLVGSLQRAVDFFSGAGWSTTISLVSVSRAKDLGQDLRLEALNPVFIVSAEKPKEE
ncbi:MAG: precorrin-6y C5,15-methyltransferase (decarboxylating) subunit CbiE [Deltaproteobacteria bacterium]|nr:precorrin-6y C5,15-methyltransferase (decarboxylating) subunit CbiE [Deltaproteobacteria bacterium]